MNKTYPSRRELRLQREREECADLRDQEARRQSIEVLARAEPVPTNQAADISVSMSRSDGEQSAEGHRKAGGGRRAAASPVDAPADVPEPVVKPPQRRRADSQVTSTGMLPLITKHRDGHAETKPRSRREAREEASTTAAEGTDKIDALQDQQAPEERVPQKPLRRATSPQAPPIPASSDGSEKPDQSVEQDVPDETPDNPITFSISVHYSESAVEITDMSGLTTLDIRRAELWAETEQLTQEIIELGQQNPNVIDQQLLRRQNELAEKSQELQELETAAITIVESQDHLETTADGQQDTTPVADNDGEVDQPARRARRASNGPMLTGPFKVTEDEDESTESKPDFATHFVPQPETDAVPTTGPERPLDASSAHGLDTLDPKQSEAPERRILTISVIVFAVGIVALIIALILLSR